MLVPVSQAGERRFGSLTVAFEWMHAVLQKEIKSDALRREVSDIAAFDILLRYVYRGRLSQRNRAMVILAGHRGFNSTQIASFLAISRQTCSRYRRLFKAGGCEALFAKKIRSPPKLEDESLKSSIFSLLHEPPANHGINRTSWKMRDLCRVLRENGRPAGSDVVRKIIKAAGYRWRTARVVLTSRDPAYSEKVARIQSILSNLRADEAFFSIDEFGPKDRVGLPSSSLIGSNSPTNLASNISCHSPSMHSCCRKFLDAR